MINDCRTAARSSASVDQRSFGNSRIDFSENIEYRYSSASVNSIGASSFSSAWIISAASAYGCAWSGLGGV